MHVGSFVALLLGAITLSLQDSPYDVRFDVDSSSGALDGAKVVAIRASDNERIDSAFTQNGIAELTLGATNVGTERQPETAFDAQVYANPTNGPINLNVTSPSVEKLTIEYFNALGQKVHSPGQPATQQLTAGVGESTHRLAPVDGLATGRYFARITSSDGDRHEVIPFIKGDAAVPTTNTTAPMPQLRLNHTQVADYIFEVTKDGYFTAKKRADVSEPNNQDIEFRLDRELELGGWTVNNITEMPEQGKVIINDDTLTTDETGYFNTIIREGTTLEEVTGWLTDEQGTQDSFKRTYTNVGHEMTDDLTNLAVSTTPYEGLVHTIDTSIPNSSAFTPQEFKDFVGEGNPDLIRTDGLTFYIDSDWFTTARPDRDFGTLDAQEQERLRTLIEDEFLEPYFTNATEQTPDVVLLQPGEAPPITADGLPQVEGAMYVFQRTGLQPYTVGIVEEQGVVKRGSISVGEDIVYGPSMQEISSLRMPNPINSANFSGRSIFSQAGSTADLTNADIYAIKLINDIGPHPTESTIADTPLADGTTAKKLYTPLSPDFRDFLED